MTLRTLEAFTEAGFLDQLPLALEMAAKHGCDEDAARLAVLLVEAKAAEYPPTRNRSAWFRTVYKEKLGEAKATIEREKAYLSRH